MDGLLGGCTNIILCVITVREVQIKILTLYCSMAVFNAQVGFAVCVQA